MIKKILKIAAIVLVLLIAFAFAAPFLFKGKIIQLVKTQANENLNAKLDFADADLSLFRHFPHISLGLDSMRITGAGEFASDTLISANTIDVSLNLWSVIMGNNIEIHAIDINHPRIHALVHKNGNANWNITKPDTVQSASTPAKPFHMQLQKYAITDGYIEYVDETGNMRSEIEHLNHEGNGDFTADLFTLKTKTHADAVTFVYGGVPYLNNTGVTVDADIQVNNKAGKYSFNTDKISVNDLKLNAEGFFQFANDSAYNMDIKFKAPSNNFKDLLSLIPVVYTKDFKGIKTSGQFGFSGFVKGLYDSKHIPAYHIDLNVNNGFFQYPDLPKPVKNIRIKANVDNPDGITDNTVVDIAQAHIEMDDAPFDLRLLLKKPLTAMYIDGAAKGKLDLAKLTQLVKLESGTKLSGLLNADISAKGSVAAAQKQQFNDFYAAGTVALNDFLYSSKAYPDPVAISNLQMTANPKNITLNALSGSYRKTNFSATGSLDNVLAYALQHKTLSGSMQVKADQFNLNDWMGTSSTSTDTTSTAASSAFVVPDNINFILNAAVGTVHYDKTDFQNLSGTIKIADETVTLDNVKTNALDGTIAMNGAYSTKLNKKNPAIAFSYDVKGLDIQKTFYAFNTVQKLMPVGKFIDGKLNSQLQMSGKLDGHLSPDLSTITGEGNVLLLDGVLKKFAPLEKLAQLVNVSQLQEISVKDIKTYFSFRNGKVIVNPFNVKVAGIAMQVGGTHGFDQSLDYAINMKVPRSMIGSQANSLVNNLVSQANAKGLAVKAGETINLNVKMGGTITNPVLNTDMKDALSSTANNLKQQATDLVQAKVDSAKKQLKDTAQVIKKQLVQTAGDELKKKLLGQKDTTTQSNPNDARKKAEETGKDLINNLFGKKKKSGS